MIEIGLKQTSELTVTETVTAIRIGSGDMPVLATPMLLALMENAAMLAVKDELPEGCTTVGGHIASSARAGATPILGYRRTVISV